jgi:hypothetical protein
MSKSDALYISARNLCVLLGSAVVLWHFAAEQDLYELLAWVMGIWLGAWLRELVFAVRGS